MKWHNVKIVGILILVFSSFSLKGQIGKNWAFESNTYVGQITKHTPKILFDVNRLAVGQDFNFKKQTYGNDKWSQFQRYPDLGISLLYFNLGDKEVLGQAIGIMPNATVKLLRTQKGFINFQIGWGLGYVNKFYHPVDNPTNNALGSAWNNLVLFKFDGGVHINNYWSTQMGFSLTHYSNGASQLPNFGINVIAANIGLRYTPNPVKREDYIFDEHHLNVPEKRWGGQVHFDLAYREYGKSGGPRYPIYVLSSSGMFHFNAVNRMHLGLEMEYNSGVYHFLKHSSLNPDLQYAKQQSYRTMVFAAHEFTMGDVGMYILLGTYLQSKEQIPGRIYNKLSARYYFKPVGKPATRFFVAVYLKSHLSVAEYLAFGVGASL